MTGNRRRVSIGAGALALALGMTGCWPSPAQGPDRNAYNPFESDLTAADVASLTEAWSAPLDGPRFTPATNPGGEIVTGHGGVYVNDATGMYRFDAADGSRDWRKPLPGFFPADQPAEFSQAFVVDDRLLVGFGTVGDLLAQGAEWRSWWLDPATGITLVDGPDEGLPTGVRGSKLALAGSACAEVSFCSGTYTVLDLDHPGVTSTGSLGVHIDNYQPPTLGTARLYHAGIDVQSVSSRIQAFPVTGGATTALWSTIIEFQTGATAPVLSPDESTLYTGSGAGGAGHTLYALDAATGAIEWRADVGAGVTAPPALAEGVLYVPTADGDLVAVDANGCGAPTCTPLWTAATGSRITSQPAVGGGVVYTGSQDGTVAAFDADGCGTATCPDLWSDATGAPITGAPVVSGGQLYVVSSQDNVAGRVVAYALP